MRRRRGQGLQKTVTVHLDEELANLLVQTMHAYGLESPASTVSMMMRAYASWSMENTTIHEVCYQSVRETKRAEFDALAEFYEGRAKMYRANAGATE